MGDLRITGPLIKIINEFLNNPDTRRSGSELAKSAKLASGTLYPLLIRLEEAGWLTSEWEETNPKELGRPRRRFYKITPSGVRLAQNVLRETFKPTEVLACG